MSDRIKLTEEHAPYNTELNGNIGVFIETHNIEESATLIKQILDDYNTWNLIDNVFGKITTINDIFELVKENKSLKETVLELSEEKLEIKEYYKQAKQKLEDIEKVVINQPLSSLAVAQLRRNLIIKILEKKK